MPRWHKETCSSPRVVIAGKIPRCEACDSVPDIQKYINQQRAIPSFTQPPPDPPLGQLNLRWPGSVKYQQQPTKAEQLDGGPSKNKENLDVIELGDNKTLVQSPIYASRLGKDEFRLLFLSPSTDQNAPVHAELVAHQDGRSPQYESTSYTWAGENGDSSKCKPLYIGRYWDVALQTQNCWSMLQSLRPPIGTRAVWVDAICINQNDIEERDSQVMKMSQRYRNCFRVVVYLGPDMATSIPAGYPAQKELVLGNSQASTGISPDSFREILCRRYFSRIWVVQELVLAKRVAFQIGDSEYWMDPTTMRSIETHTDWDWNSTAAPWLQNVGLERLQATDILRILRATQMCQCADPRDRVFGILSLLSNNSADSVLRADYSLSFREMVIGLFSHTLLELRDLGVLRFAAGSRNYSKFPSWMPDLSLSARYDSSQNGLRLANYRLIVSDHEMHHGGTPWYLGTTVNSSTGALSIKLIHLFEFQSSPQRMEDVEFIKGCLWAPADMWRFKIKDCVF
ncbi:heterokaryon incompatibility het-6 [Fusarium pseudoanthophilum]|uniref:Heterokaryon incompatibility het-6 n=1 Tax=Fusarium pseudoanthophilum TaxID=48495 RepID=A0A8H5NV13_9HYPO|nr:heterokaryon incompatibility het-6 [Fusarium pseudoanthophilum]